MMKLSRILLVLAVVLGLSSVTFGAEYWVIREKKRCVIVKVKPADASVIFKGPFRDRKEAEVVIKECAPAGRAAVVEYWVIREPSGALVIVQEKPSDPAIIVKGPFRDRRQAEVLIKKSPSGGAAAPGRGPTEQPKAVPERAPTGERPGVTKPMEKTTPGAGEKPGVTPAPPPGERPGAPKPMEKTAPGASKPGEGVKTPPTEKPGGATPGEKPAPGGGEKPGASKEDKPQQ